jgi:preprotein translocase subunit SecA
MSVTPSGSSLSRGIQHPWITKAVESAQRKVEGMNFDIRKQLIDFDNVMNRQREAVYNLRNEILEGEDITDTIKDMIYESIEEKLDTWASAKYSEEWDFVSIDTWLSRTFGIHYEQKNENGMGFLTREALSKDIYDKVLEAYEKRKNEITKELMSQIQRMVLLQMIDSSWKDHLYELDQLKRGIGFRAYAQKDPKVEYQKESFALFEAMMKRIRENTIEYIFKVQISIKPPHLQGYNDSAEGTSLDRVLENKKEKVKHNKLNNLNKIGRNDFCPCGSGKKYKKCCGSN